MNPLDLLSRNLALFVKMKELAARQKELILVDQVDLFQRLSSEREKLQYEISSNEKRYGRQVRHLSAHDRDATAHAVTSQILDVIGSIQDTDREVEEIIREKNQDILMEARGIRHGQKALRGYGVKPPGPPKFVDREG